MATADSKSFVRDSYCVMTIQSGAMDWIKGEFVIRPSVPSEALMPKAEMLEDPKLAT
jgi:hypothetical protein